MCINTTKFASLLTTRRQSIRLLNQRYVESRDDHNHRNCVKIHRIKVYGLHFLETVPDKSLIYKLSDFLAIRIRKHTLKATISNIIWKNLWKICNCINSEKFLHHVKSLKSDLLPISKRYNCSWFSRALLIRQITVSSVCFYRYILLHYNLVLNGKRDK